MYKIIGGDGNEYGPVNAETLRQWIAEGRVNGETKTRSETGEWKPLAEFPEFAVAMGAQAAPRPESPIAVTAPAPFSTGGQGSAVYEGDYQLDMGGCIMRGWELFKANFGVLFGGMMIYLLVEIVVSVLSAIPLIGFIFSLASLVITGPLIGGLFYLFLRVVRGEAAEAGDVFAGFRRAFGQLFLGHIVTALFMGLCLIPAIIVFILIMMPAVLHHQNIAVPQIGIVGAVSLFCLIPMVYLQVSWLFTMPLIVDKDLDFWSAMKTSWARVNLHWWHVFGLTILVGLLYLIPMSVGGAGIIFGLVQFAAKHLLLGVSFTVFGAGWLLLCAIFLPPIGMAALMFAYETIFSGKDATAS